MAIVNYERIKRTTRLYFVCGLRAVNLLYKQSQALKRLGLRLTAPPDADSVEKAFDKHMEEVENLRKKMAEEEKKVIKDIVKNIEQKLVPQKNNAGVSNFLPSHHSLFQGTPVSFLIRQSSFRNSAFRDSLFHDSLLFFR